MLNASHLRIGNWILTFDPRDGKNHDQHPCQVAWQHMRALEVERKTNFNPITVSDAILQASGWEQKDDSVFTHFLLKDDLVLQKTEGGFQLALLQENKRIGEVVQYVHELQNLLHCLSRQEWEVKMDGIPV